MIEINPFRLYSFDKGKRSFPALSNGRLNAIGIGREYNFPYFHDILLLNVRAYPRFQFSMNYVIDLQSLLPSAAWQWSHKKIKHVWIRPVELIKKNCFPHLPKYFSCFITLTTTQFDTDCVFIKSFEFATHSHSNK